MQVEINTHGVVRTRTGEVAVSVADLSPAAIQYLFNYGLQQAGNDRAASEADPVKKLTKIRDFVGKLANPNFVAELRAGGSSADETYLTRAGTKLLVDWKAVKGAALAADLKGKSGSARVAEIQSHVQFFVRRKYATILGVTESALDTAANFDPTRLETAFDNHWSKIETYAEELRDIDAQRRAIPVESVEI